MEWGSMVGIGVGVASIIFAYYVWTQSRRSRLVVRLERAYSVDPQDFDQDLVVQMRFGGQVVTNLTCMELELRLQGSSDYDDPSAGAPPVPGGRSRPCVQFANFRVLGVRTLERDSDDFDVRLSKAFGDRVVYLNIHRFQAKRKATFRLLGTEDDPMLPVDFWLVPGCLKNVDVKAQGYLPTMQQIDREMLDYQTMEPVARASVSAGNAVAVMGKAVWEGNRRLVAGDYEGASRYYKAARDQGWHTYLCDMNDAMVLLARGQHDEAKFLATSLKPNPGSPTDCVKDSLLLMCAVLENPAADFTHRLEDLRAKATRVGFDIEESPLRVLRDHSDRNPASSPFGAVLKVLAEASVDGQ